MRRWPIRRCGDRTLQTMSPSPVHLVSLQVPSPYHSHQIPLGISFPCHSIEVMDVLLHFRVSAAGWRDGEAGGGEEARASGLPTGYAHLHMWTSTSLSLHNASLSHHRLKVVIVCPPVCVHLPYILLILSWYDWGGCIHS